MLMTTANTSNLLLSQTRLLLARQYHSSMYLIASLFQFSAMHKTEGGGQPSNHRYSLTASN
jgi:hypothetical protein